MTIERLIGLTLIHVYKHMKFEVEQIINNFACAFPKTDAFAKRSFLK